MKNRAKCKKCQGIVESFHSTDMVLCHCGAIYVDGGDAMRCGANDWADFIRVDDLGNEIVPLIKEEQQQENMNTKPTKREVHDIINNMLSHYENLPSQALSTPVTNYELMGVLMLLSSLSRPDLS